MIVAILAILLADTSPAPALPAPASPAPAILRHLEYSFSANYEGLSEGHYNGISSGTSGVASGAHGGSRHGKIPVDVDSIAPDGALAISIAEQLWDEPRAYQTYTCTVYGNTVVLCPSYPHPSDAEWSLLGYLGRQFVDNAPWDSNNHWQRKDSSRDYDLVEDFTLADASNPQLVRVTETKKTHLHDARMTERTDDVAIVYDRTKEIPDSIRDEMKSWNASGSSNAVFEFKLITDSYAQK